MKFRLLWPLVALVLLAVIVSLVRNRTPAHPARTDAQRERITRPGGFDPPPPAIPPVTVTPPQIAPPRVALPAPPQRLAPEMVIPIQDRATIDFSIGAPVVRSGGEDAEALNRALRQMDEVTRNITFPPTRSEPAPAPRQ